MEDSTFVKYILFDLCIVDILKVKTISFAFVEATSKHSNSAGPNCIEYFKCIILSFILATIFEFDTLEDNTS